MMRGRDQLHVLAWFRGYGTFLRGRHQDITVNAFLAEFLRHAVGELLSVTVSPAWNRYDRHRVIPFLISCLSNEKRLLYCSKSTTKKAALTQLFRCGCQLVH
jgi:hypothetical protein